MVGAVVTDVSRELKDKQRRQRARQQLLKLNKKKREEKIASLLKELGQHLEVKSQQGTMDPEEYQLLLEDNGHDSEEVSEKMCVQWNHTLKVDNLSTTLQSKSPPKVDNLSTTLQSKSPPKVDNLSTTLQSKSPPKVDNLSTKDKRLGLKWFHCTP